MKLAVRHWDHPDRVRLASMFGWLDSWLSPFEPPTVNMAVIVHMRAPGFVPLVELDPTSSHPLAREQRKGITLHRMAELNRLLLEG